MRVNYLGELTPCWPLSLSTTKNRDRSTPASPSTRARGAAAPICDRQSRAPILARLGLCAKSCPPAAAAHPWSADAMTPTPAAWNITQGCRVREVPTVICTQLPSGGQVPAYPRARDPAALFHETGTQAKRHPSRRAPAATAENFKHFCPPEWERIWALKKRINPDRSTRIIRLEAVEQETFPRGHAPGRERCQLAQILWLPRTGL